MKKIRVIHILSSNKYSGAENVVFSIIKNIDNVECIYVSPKGEIEERLDEEKIPYYGLDRLGYFNLKKAIEYLKPDIIHAHDFIASTLSSLVSKGRYPVISHLHHNPPFIKKYCLYSIIYYLASADFNSVLTVSDSVMDEYVFGNKLKNKTKIVGNPFDLSNIRKMAESAIVDDKSDIIFLARMIDLKRPLEFLDIIFQLKENFPNIKVNMVGSGNLDKEVQNKICNLNLEENVKFYGFQKNPYGLLKNSKVLCIPSKWEGFGLVALEAFALGKPVVASNVGGLKDIVNESCGYLCVGEKQIYDSLKNLLSNDSLYEKKSKAALTQIKKYDNIKLYCENLRNYYFEILSNS